MSSKKLKKILFLSGTRADFGKIKSLMKICQKSADFEVQIFATGMHLHHKYGYTVNEIEKSGFENIYKFINYTSETSMDLTLAKTIEGLSSYIQEEITDMIVVHGDRLEALAGAIVGSMNNILVAHIEGGEVSGTIDELIRHSVSKLSHLHFVSNLQAKKRLIQMGEDEKSIFEIGSPDVDVMFSKNLPSLKEAKEYYDINFDNFGMVMFHPVTTEVEKMESASSDLVDSLIDSGLNYIVIYPNNDLGSSSILKSYQKLKNNKLFKIYPSIRFEYFLVLLKYSNFIIGNSSAGIREAPYYGIPSINIGSRQNERALSSSIIHADYTQYEISDAILKALHLGTVTPEFHFGNGKSDELFLDILNKKETWQTSKQKKFIDIN